MTSLLFRLLLPLALLASSGPALAYDDGNVLTLDKKVTKRQRTAQNKIVKLARKWVERNPVTALRWFGPTPDLTPGSVPASFIDRDGHSRPTVLDSPRELQLAIGHAEVAAMDKAKLLRTYRRLFDIFPPARREGLPAPASLERGSRRALTAALRAMTERLGDHFAAIRADISQVAVISGLTQNPIGVCSTEVGYETAGGDSEVSQRCEVGAYSPLGITAHATWPLKDDITCIKDQGDRGTCAAHAIAAAVESDVLIHGGPAENVGEQNIYFFGKLNVDWWARYTDGLQLGATLDALDAENYLIQYESVWNYNRSLSRGAYAPSSASYPDSCDPSNYFGEQCTNFAFQGPEDLSRNPARYTHPHYSATSGREIRAWSYATMSPGLLAPELSASAAVLLLESEVPILISMSVPPAFFDPAPGGYVNHVPGQVGSGSHLVLAVGFVANSALPAGAPLDPAGVGYFVIKNSWGIYYGDCGFAYASYDFMTRWAAAWAFLDDVR